MDSLFFNFLLFLELLTILYFVCRKVALSLVLPTIRTFSTVFSE